MVGGERVGVGALTDELMHTHLTTLTLTDLCVCLPKLRRFLVSSERNSHSIPETEQKARKEMTGDPLPSRGILRDGAHGVR